MNKCLIILSFFVSVCIDRTVLENSLQCGVRQIRTRDLIVNGLETVPGEWPWHAAIYHRKYLVESYACGGTLISENFVITAAHCVKGENKYQLSNKLIFVRLGVHNLEVLDKDTFQQHNVEKIYQPSENTNQSLKNDIALLKLDKSAKFTEYVQPACMDLTEELTRQLGTVVGWGVTENEELSPTLRSAQLPVIDPVECLESNRPFIGTTLDRGMFCAGYTNGTSVCNGDSGGGLVFNKSNVWYLGGIVSFAQSDSFHLNRCYTEGYTVFTKINFYLEWISNITNQPFYTNYDLLPQRCGVYSTSRIRGGKKAKLFEFPWMAMLLSQFIRHYFIMDYAGTLVSKRYVLTAADPNDRYLSAIKVRLGEFDREQDPDCSVIDGERKCAPQMKEYGIERIITHPNYKKYSEVNNIALIRLDEDVGFEDHIQPICLPVTQSLKDLSLSKYIVTGWGENETYGDQSTVLLKATVFVANKSECRYHSKETDNFICTGGINNSTICLKDKGGPLGFPAKYIDGMRFVQFGIITPIFFCAATPFSIHTKVSNYMDWIMQNLEP